jgi:dimethylhistidine N-methyltransferase
MATVTTEIPACHTLPELQPEFEPAFEIAQSLLAVVRDGLSQIPKQLPAWLFYDAAGSLLFDRITQLPEYYLTRVERGIFERSAAEMIAAAANGGRLRMMELGAGSADKTRLLLAAACDYQKQVCYQPVDVSASALETACERLERELPSVATDPLVADYTTGLYLDPCQTGERRLALFIGSSIGNFDPEAALSLLSHLHDALSPGDGLLLGVDLAPTANGKTVPQLIAAYDDSQGVTAQFNKNMLARLNRELGAEFDLSKFRHQIRWNREASRIEMHLESLAPQTVAIAALGQTFDFASGETIHTENSHKYRPGEAETLLSAAGFHPERRWSDAEGLFAVHISSRS